jgi:acyl carrier protein
MDLRIKVIDIVKEETGIDLSKIDPDQSLSSQVQIDSMKFVEVYAALVDELQMEISPEILGADSLNQFFNYIEKANRP